MRSPWIVCWRRCGSAGGFKSASIVSSELARSGLKLPKGRWFISLSLSLSHSLFLLASQHATVWHDVHAHDARVRARRPCHASSVPEGYARVIEFIRDDEVNDPFSGVALPRFTTLLGRIRSTFLVKAIIAQGLTE
jgi:hypothetical protein